MTSRADTADTAGPAPDDGRPRGGRGGRAVAVGVQARRSGPALLAIGLVLLALAGWQYGQESDLRDLPALARATAEVLDEDDGSRGQDHLEVRFTPAGGAPVTARIPTGSPAEVGDTVEVAYVPGSPDRVRTVEDWTAWKRPGTHGLALGLAGLAVTGFGLVSRARRSRYEEGAPAPATRSDRGLGRRVVRASPVVPAFLLGVGVLLVGVALADPVGRGATARGVLLGTAVLVSVVPAAGVLLWGGGRDGVWATDTHLVARRRRTLRRWPWDQVHELGLVVQEHRVERVAARVDDGDADGIGPDGWITLARPLAGPLSAHDAAVQVRALAETRGIPLTEGLTEYELADGIMGSLSRLTADPPRRRAPRAGTDSEP